MNLFELCATIVLDTGSYKRGVTDAKKAGEAFATQLRKGLSVASKAAADNLISLGDSTEDASKEMREAQEKSQSLASQMKGALTSAIKSVAVEMEKTETASEKLNGLISEQQDELKRLKNEYTDAVLQYGKTSNEAKSLSSQIKKLSTELKENQSQMRSAESAADKFDRSLGDLNDSADSATSVFGKLSSTLKKGLAIGTIVGGVQTLIGSITSLVDGTEEYRKIMGTLETSSEAAGYSAAETAESYRLLYSVLGDNQTAATTLANLQAIGLAQDDLTSVINSAIGAWATYGDSIPIDSLAESINETIRAGQVTGTFADVLNWGSQEGETFGVTMRASTEANEAWNTSVQNAKTAEDFFNLALQNCGTEAERVDLILQTMSAQGLTQAADAWKENNSSIIETNEAQMKYEEAQARLAEKLTPIKTALTNLASGGFDLLTSAINGVSNALSALGQWWDRTQPKIESAWNKFWGIEDGSHYGRLPDGSYGWIDGSHARGLSYVPFDGYIAELHKGEAVLTSEQADMLRNPEFEVRTVSGPSMLDRMERTMSRMNATGGDINITVQSVLDGKIIGETSYKYIRNKQRAYGV